jgi:hypothetical protein
MAQNQQENRIADVEPQSMDLYDDFVPGIEAGTYRFVAQQSVLYALPARPGAPSPEAAAYHYYRDQRFVVKGPRYSLPPDEFHATFPPDGGMGDYWQSLPHVVLRKRALPWERTVWPPASEHDEPAPWLALLVLTQAELDAARAAFDALDRPAGSTKLLSTVAPADLFSSDPGLGPGLNGKPSLLPQIDPHHAGEGDDSDHDGKVNVLDLPYETFRAACPRHADLAYLAHVRCVNTADKAPLAMHADGDFAVLMANRFPQPGGNVVYLISLEGWGPVIEELDTLGHQPRADRVRLVLLGSWTFTDDETGAHTFGGLMQNLDAGAFGALPAGVSTGDATTDAYLSHGYAPIEYQPREGSATFAWYRGPFAPGEVANLETGSLYARSDAALILDPQAGLLDISYAAAWQLGRLQALASPSFADDLRLFLDLHHDAHNAFAAAQDLARALQIEQGAFGDLWRDELKDLIHTLWTGQLDEPTHEELLDGLVGAGLSRSTAEAVIRAFQEAASGDDLQAMLAGAGLTPAQIADLLAVRQAPPTPPAPDVVAGDDLLRWLARLAMLYPTPFSYLVAHERLLPSESLRFFYVDNNWVEALLDGSLSIALECDRDAAALAGSRHDFHKAVSQLVYQYRLHLRGLLDVWEPAEDAPDTYMDEVKTGFLLRSAAISGWPGTEIQCFDDAGGKLTVLRMDHLAPDLLLCLVEGKIGKVVLKEPAEGIRFGVDDDGSIMLRHWRSDVTGSPIGGDARLDGVQADFARTDAAAGVLDVGRLAVKLAAQVADLDHLDKATIAQFGSAAFALQMLRSPEMQTILWR